MLTTSSIGGSRRASRFCPSSRRRSTDPAAVVLKIDDGSMREDERTLSLDNEANLGLQQTILSTDTLSSVRREPSAPMLAAADSIGSALAITPDSPHIQTWDPSPTASPTNPGRGAAQPRRMSAAVAERVAKGVRLPSPAPITS